MSQNSAISPERSLQREILPFTLQDVRQAIPSHCFVPQTWRSLAYFAFDMGVVALLFGLVRTIDQAWFYPIYWFCQGTMFWALFVIGHDCGHGSFSRYRWLNSLVGHITHTLILVPYHGWRISHRTHHANTGNIDHDESWYPVSESQYRQMSWYEKLARYHLFLLIYPLYLFKRSPNKSGSHFMPDSPLFRQHEQWQVLTSTFACTAMLGFLAAIALSYGWWALIKFYAVPYLIFVVWLDLVTFLHHTDTDIPWYRGEDWYFLKGALSTVDRDYGWFNPIHHHIGTHVVHHIFNSIPHYHLSEATSAIQPVLGKYYRKSSDPVWRVLWRAYRNCHYVSDRGTKVYYQSANADQPHS